MAIKEYNFEVIGKGRKRGLFSAVVGEIEVPCEVGKIRTTLWTEPQVVEGFLFVSLIWDDDAVITPIDINLGEGYVRRMCMGSGKWSICLHGNILPQNVWRYDCANNRRELLEAVRALLKEVVGPVEYELDDYVISQGWGGGRKVHFFDRD